MIDGKVLLAGYIFTMCLIKVLGMVAWSLTRTVL